MFRWSAGVSSALRCWTQPDPLACGLWSEPSHQPSAWRARGSRRRETILGSRPQRNSNLRSGRNGESTQAQANALEKGPHLAKGALWAKYVRSGAQNSGESAVVLAGTCHPALRVASTCAHRFLRSVARTGRPHPRTQAVSSGRNAWSNEASEHEVRASASLASLLSISLATIWGLPDEGLVE